ncbi:major facilitator superfamily transporter [Fusarium albosuccineum]|uniref:Major facilitator superfamily transporter n=1 Tax=Fusarium albosuccineum TaxID=1237068 RepID=A0A8H4PC89_9HYPO|nr:major facilitator superfamily transporter [Fusarium albosuccineum]
MHLNSALLVAVASLVSTGTASEKTSLDGYRLLTTDNFNGVDVHWFGPSDDDKTLTARGSSNCDDRATDDAWSASLSCDDSNGADATVCALLVDTLGASMDQSIPASPRQVCVSDHGSWCCTSWSVEVGGLTYGDLYNGAQRVWSSCNTNGVSGYLEMYKLGGGDACMHQNKGIAEPEHILWTFLASLTMVPYGLLLWGLGATYEPHWFALVFAQFALSISNAIACPMALSYAISSYPDMSGELVTTTVIIRNTMTFAINYGITPWIR